MRYLAILLFTFIAYFGSAQVRLNQLERCPDGADCCITTDSRGVQYYIYPCSELWDSLLLFYVNDSIEVRLGDTLTFRDSGAVRVFIDTAKKTVTYYVDSAGIDTDHQTLTWDNNTRTLSIIRGNSVVIPDSVNVDTDDQYPDVFNISNDTLYLSLDGSDTLKKVYLGGYLDDTDTDDQYIDSISYSSDTLRISLHDDGQDLKRVYIPPTVDTDDQYPDLFYISGDSLYLSLDNSDTLKRVYLGGYLDDTDNYVDAVSYDGGTLTLGRTGILPDLTTTMGDFWRTHIGDRLPGLHTDTIYRIRPVSIGTSTQAGVLNIVGNIGTNAGTYNNIKDESFSNINNGSVNNFGFGYRNFNSSNNSASSYNTAIGSENYLNLGNVNASYNSVFGRLNATNINVTTQYNLISGYNNADIGTGGSLFSGNLIVGINNLRSINTGANVYNLVVGAYNAYSSPYVAYTTLLGERNAYLATGGSLQYDFFNGYRNLYNGAAKQSFFNGNENLFSSTSTTNGNLFLNGNRNIYAATGQIVNTFANGNENLRNASGADYTFANGYQNFYTSTQTVTYCFANGLANFQLGQPGRFNFASGGYNFYSGGSAGGGDNYNFAHGNANFYNSTSSSYSIGIGKEAFLSATSTNHAVGIGNRPGYGATDLSAVNTIAIGDQALLNASSLDNVTALGWQSGKSNAFAYVTLLGDTAVATADRQFAVSNYYQTAKLKNYLFNIDQDTSGKNGYVLTYNHASKEIELSNAPTLAAGSDNYVDAASYAGYTLTLGRTGVLADFNIPIDIQYLDTFQVTNDTLFASIANDGRAASKVNLSGFRDHDFYNVWNANIYPFHIDTAVYRTGKTVMGSTNDVAGILNVVGNIGVNGGSYNTVKDGSFRGATSTGNNNVGLGYRNSYLNQSGSWIAAFGQQNFENVSFSNYLFASGQDNFKTAAGNYNFGFGLQNGQNYAVSYNFLAGYRNAQNAGSYITAFGQDNFKTVTFAYNFANGYNNASADTAGYYITVFGDNNLNGTTAGGNYIDNTYESLFINGYNKVYAHGTNNFGNWANVSVGYALGADNFTFGVLAKNAFAFGNNNNSTNTTGYYWNTAAFGEYNLNNINGDVFNVFAHGESNALRGTDLVNVLVQGYQNLNQTLVFGGSVENVLIQGKDNMRNIKTAFGSMAQGATNFYETKQSVYGYALGVNNFYSADTVNTSFGMGNNNFQAAANVRNSVSIGSGFTSITGNADFLINVGYGFESQTSATKAILIGSTSRDTLATSTANNTIIFGHDAFVHASEIDSTIVVGNSAGNSNAWKSNILLGHGAKADTSYQFRVGANYRQAALNRYRLNIDQDTTSKNDWVLTKVPSGEIELKALPSSTDYDYWIFQTWEDGGDFDVMTCEDTVFSHEVLRFYEGTGIEMSCVAGGFVTISSSGGATDLTFTGASSPYTLNSSSGTDVTFAQGGIVTLSRSTNQLTISATEVDGSVSNEGTLGVGAGGGASSSTIISNTSGATGVTLNVAGNLLTIGETTNSNGGSITITGNGMVSWNLDSPDDIGGATTISNGNTVNVDGSFGIGVAVSGTTLFLSGEALNWNLGANGSYTTIGDAGSVESVNFVGSGIASTSRSGNQITIAATEVDGSITNEVDNLTFSGASSPYTLNSSGGTDVTFTGGTGITLSATSGNMNISATDASISNEGTLGVGAGGANTAVITSNTSGASGVTINGSTGITITETTSSNGGQINIFDDNASVWYESGDVPANDNTSYIYHTGNILVGSLTARSGSGQLLWVDATTSGYTDIIGHCEFGYSFVGESSSNNVKFTSAQTDVRASTSVLLSVSGTAKITTESTQIITAVKTGIKRTPATNDLEVEGAASKNTAGDWLANSDRRIKDLIHPVQEPYDIMERLEPVTFRYTDEYLKLNPSIKDRVYYNYIAQDYAKVFPDDVKGSGEYLPGDKEEILQMDGHAASIATTAAVKQLIQDLKALKRRVDEQEKEIKALRSKRK